MPKTDPYLNRSFTIPKQLRLDALSFDGDLVTIHASTENPAAECPLCDNPSCERRIFAERLPGVAQPFARGTDRQKEALEWITFVLGGEAGARLADELGFVVGRDALLSRAKSAPPPDGGKVRVLGVDDFAVRRGHTYGTVLVDLERRRVVDLLPERSQEDLVGWMRRHPEGLDDVIADLLLLLALPLQPSLPHGTCSKTKSPAG